MKLMMLMDIQHLCRCGDPNYFHDNNTGECIQCDCKEYIYEPCNHDICPNCAQCTICESDCELTCHNDEGFSPH